jgi:hypothetical protein
MKMRLLTQENKDNMMDTLQLVYGVLKVLKLEHENVKFEMYPEEFVSGSFCYFLQEEGDVVLYEFNNLNELYDIIHKFIK